MLKESRKDLVPTHIGRRAARRKVMDAQTLARCTGAQLGRVQAFADLLSAGMAEGRKAPGNTQPGDGSHFRGHGLIQTTGRGVRGAFRHVQCPLDLPCHMRGRHRLAVRDGDLAPVGVCLAQTVERFAEAVAEPQPHQQLSLARLGRPSIPAGSGTPTR